MSERLIHYKAIFVQDGQKDVVEYKEKGTYEIGDKHCISFVHDGIKIKITYDDIHVELKQGSSVLLLNRDHDVWNDYQLMYGTVTLRVKVCHLEVMDDSLKLKYELYDLNGLISSVYIIVTMI